VRKLAGLVLLLCACKSGPQPADGASGEDATRYYPLAVGNSWTYAFRGSDKQETIRIIGRDGPWFIDDHRGRLRYEKDGVRDADRYLLRTPLAVGAKWSAVENVVVTVAEDGCSHCQGVAEDSLCRVATAVDLRLYFFDNDAFASFNRFHITQILRCCFRFPWYSRSPHFTCVY